MVLRYQSTIQHCINADILIADVNFFWFSNGGQISQPIFMQNGLIDAHSPKDMPFALKIETFSHP